MTRQKEYYREGVDPEKTANVRLWLEQWYGDSSAIKISKTKFKFPASTKERGTPFKSAFQKNQSTLHGYLKFIVYYKLYEDQQSLRYISNKAGYSHPKPEYEVRMYYPIEELLEEITQYSGTFDIFEPQVIEKGRTDVYAEYGEIKSVDVYCEILASSISVEVGYTQPCNLLLPLLYGLVNTAIWVPFPRKLDPSNFDLKNKGIRTATAYEISFK
ncbi:MAG: hypothetical protein AB2689_21645 [Candidatus Thiodiazotropha taylori]